MQHARRRFSHEFAVTLTALNGVATISFRWKVSAGTEIMNIGAILMSLEILPLQLLN
jgi:hypothetical protein